MPIHTSWKSMARGMVKTYCKGGIKKGTNLKFADGKSVRVCPKARDVFYATVTKIAGKGGETKPKPKTNPKSKKKKKSFKESTVIMWYMKKKGLI